ncbi:cupin domain-containing protein [Bosea sp. 117]|uniref:cupin domain-containing protein n=1 Tax=Bosea sp. 117 TaxID=1125973 RepID=UPI0012DC9B32|nr:cupin domain-containing protein [Bosea sp. 117]
MNIDLAMEQYFGPKGVVLPDQGTTYRLAEPGITAQIKLAPGDYTHFKFTAVRYDLEPGASLDLAASLYAGRMLYGLEGDGEIVLNGRRRPFPEGTFVHVGEGHHVALANTGAAPLQVFSFVFGPSPEARADLMTRDLDGQLWLEITDTLRKVFGLVSREQAAALPDAGKGELVYLLPNEGPSYWQAKPSAGFVEVKLAPFTSNVHHYGVLMQTLFPGCGVREHGHNQLSEFFVISKGLARAALDGQEALCPKGTVIVIGRNVMHYWANAGETDAQNFAIVDPPGVEGALAITGRLRGPNETWPDDIPRNAETGKILHDRFGFVIRGNAADRTG